MTARSRVIEPVSSSVALALVAASSGLRLAIVSAVAAAAICAARIRHATVIAVGVLSAVAGLSIAAPSPPHREQRRPTRSMVVPGHQQSRGVSTETSRRGE